MIEKFVTDQYRQPAGLLGELAGTHMSQQHERENTWTVMLLNAQPADRILEIGFGPGKAIQRIAARVTKGVIAGVDHSQTMVRQAKWRNRQQIKNGHIDLRNGDVKQLPFGNGSFNKAFSIHCIYFWPDPLAAVKEIRRVLIPGGTLMLTILPKEKWAAERITPGTFVYTVNDVMSMLRAAGFQGIRAESGPSERHFPCVTIIGTNPGMGPR